MNAQLRRSISLLLYLSLILVGMRNAQDSTCYPCDALNRQTLEECIGTEEDCDSCQEGYQEVSWTTFCAPSDSLVLDHDQNATVERGGSALVRCQFESAVDCVWQRDGTLHLEIGDLNRYIDGRSNGVNTSECSILIERFGDEDGGLWECKSMADSETDAVKMTALWLSSEADIIESPENTTVSTGDTALLSCRFDAAVQCFWTKDGATVDIETEERYRYAITEPNSCSIEIQEVKSADVGEWKCGGQSPSGRNIVASSVWIATSPEDVPKGPEDVPKGPEDVPEGPKDVPEGGGTILIAALAIVGTVIIAAIIATAVVVSRRRRKAVDREAVEIYELQERPSLRPMLNRGSYSACRNDDETS